MVQITLFVYGTLKRGLRNHHLLAGQEFIRTARTLPYYRLFDTGPFPGLVEVGEGGNPIQGELWQVDEATMGRLDALEVAPIVFARQSIAVEGVEEPVIAYLYKQDITGLRDSGECWP